MEHDELVTDVVDALTGWTVAVVQFNGLVAARMGVTDTALQCLYVLFRHGPSTTGELGRRVNLTSGAASRMVDRLEAAGLVRRTPDPGDRRRVLVEPVPDAGRRVGELYSPLTDRLREHLAGWDPDELRRVLAFAVAAEESTDAEIRRL